MGDSERPDWEPIGPAGVDLTGTGRLCAQVVARLPVDGAAVTVRGGAVTKELLFATDRSSARLDDLQFVLGEGPGLDAYRLRVPVLEPDLAAVTVRWPVFGREAIAAGAAAVFAFPLLVGAIPFGVLEMYRSKAGGFTAGQITTAVLLADAAVLQVLQDLEDADLNPTPANPEPLFGRDEVPMATGMIAVQLGVGIDQALVELRTAAFTSNRSIIDVADDVLTGRITFTTADPAPD